MAECLEPTSSETSNANVMSTLRVKIDDLVNCQSVERQMLEFKASWNMGPTKLQVIKTISAFANDFYNNNGGYIVIGVAEEEMNSEAARQIVLPPVGINPKDIELIQKQIMGECKKLISPSYSPILSPEVLQGKHVLVIWAQASNHRPHKVKLGKGEYEYYIRKGPETTKAKDEEMKALQENSNEIPFDDRMARLGMLYMYRCML